MKINKKLCTKNITQSVHICTILSLVKYSKRVYNVYIRRTKRVNALNPAAIFRKVKTMEEMSTYELETFLKMILTILNDGNDIEEAKDKIKALLER